MDKKRYMLFSNGTEFTAWQSHNCDKCVKTSRYNEKTNTYTKYRCAIQKHIDDAYLGDGKGSKRDYEATHSTECPYKQTEKKNYPRKKKDLSLKIDF